MIPKTYFNSDEIIIPKGLPDAKYLMRKFHTLARKNGAYAVDTETTGLLWTLDQLLMIPLYTPGMSLVLPLAWPGVNLSVDNAKELMNKLARDATIRAYLHNAKFDMHFLYNHGVYLDNEIHDTCVMGFDLDVTKSAKLKIRAQEELGLEMVEFKDKFKIGGKHKLTLLDYPATEVAKYAALDSFATYNLADKYLTPTLPSDPYHHSVRLINDDPDIPMLYDRIDSKIVPILWAMERAGICVDVPKLLEYKETYTKDLEELEKNILKEAGVAFNMRSPKQVTQAFARRGIPMDSTDEKHLAVVAKRGDKLAKLMMEHRTKSKILSTYITTMLENQDSSGRVHSSFNIHIAATGRLSSSAPINLQNQPKERWWRDIFIASPGHALIVRDYSQIELRILAIVSEDPVLLEEYRRGADVHMNNGKTIAKALGHDVEKLTKAQLKAFRTQGKSSLGFGVIFGMGAQALAQILGVTVDEADILILTIFNKYKGVDRWMKRVKQSGMRSGFSKTPFGRRRDIPNVFSKDKGKISYGLRQMVNSCIQGGAGDFVKLAIIEVAKNKRLKELGFRMLIQVHDELVCEAPIEHAEECNEILIHCMSNFSAARKMPIPFPTDGGIGATWGEAKGE